MEPISEGEWNSFNGICSEEADFMAQLLSNWPSHENVNTSDVNGNEMYSFSSHESYYNQHMFVANNNNLMTMDYGLMESKNETDDFFNQDLSNESIVSEDVLHGRDLQLGREHKTTVKEENFKSPSEVSKKRPRVQGEYQRGKKSMKLKKYTKVDDDDDEEYTKNENENNNGMLLRQSSSCCCSEDDSNEGSSSSKKNGALNLSGKTRASRGSATDPQSLYARKRRERINERLKTLQNLVPNGTKVDISTMLEEAVQYVKFLQLQIKLLSSDDTWMYAPLAYNGMDLGLDLTISTHRS